MADRVVLLMTRRGYYQAMRPSVYTPACHGCGACCLGMWGVTIHHVPGEECALPPGWTVHDRDSRYARLAQIGRGAAMVAERYAKRVVLCDVRLSGKCIGMRGKAGVDAYCSCYLVRPTECMEFVAGSWNCLASRIAAGLRVPAWFWRAHGRLMRGFRRKP